ncbi:unnamed protein product [Brassica oleracea]
MSIYKGEEYMELKANIISTCSSDQYLKTEVTWRLISLTKELNHRCFHQRLPTSAGGEDIRKSLM